jgi:hypothetical protein
LSTTRQGPAGRDTRSFDERFLEAQDLLELGTEAEADAASLRFQELLAENPARARALIRKNAARTIDRTLRAVLSGGGNRASLHIPSYEDDPAEAEEWAAAMWLAFERLLTETVERFVASYPLGPGLGAWQAREALDNVARDLDVRAEAGLEAEEEREDPRVVFSTRGEHCRDSDV